MSLHREKEHEKEVLISLIFKRGRYLDLLCNSPLSKPELVEILETSRSTVDRAIRELESMDLVHRQSKKYQVTEFGQIVTELYRFFRDCIDGFCAIQNTGATFPTSQCGGLVMFENATVTVAEFPDTDRPLQRFLGEIQGADHIKGLSPAVRTPYIPFFNSRLIEHGPQVELIVTSQVVDCLRTTYLDDLTDALAAKQLTLLEIDEQLPFGLALTTNGTETHTSLMLYSDCGIQCLIQNDTRLAVGWGELVYQHYKTMASEITDSLI